jgi:hypothetical protein
MRHKPHKTFKFQRGANRRLWHQQVGGILHLSSRSSSPRPEQVSAVVARECMKKTCMGLGLVDEDPEFVASAWLS